MSMLTRTARPAAPPRTPVPPPLRLPRFLLRQLAQPLASLDDVEDLVAHIRMAGARGLL